MIRFLFISVLFACAALGVGAQGISALKHNLSCPDSTTFAKVMVVEHGDAASLIATLQAQKSADDKIKGYRVRVFFDNSQSARSLASATITRFREFFPDVPAYMSYENPYFKVTVGNCISSEEAIILWGRIKNSFDRAFVVRETVQISSLTE